MVLQRILILRKQFLFLYEIIFLVRQRMGHIFWNKSLCGDALFLWLLKKVAKVSEY